MMTQLTNSLACENLVLSFTCPAPCPTRVFPYIEPDISGTSWNAAYRFQAFASKKIDTKKLKIASSLFEVYTGKIFLSSFETMVLRLLMRSSRSEKAMGL